ncbi:SDR family NAD(P)-dependent oxidoreductase [Novosphingobium arvoryzae]|uniref:Short-chain type dehydrogenase/reductase y4lA n=1 Tax=Novosphingobium arvoryzae TaxID=1256514 RepID=A0A918VJZ0_9SPHN|nr:SDR family oxidoreductase [Novosphingobium arvoryzae]GHA05105.1 putative short-chain type dehydrogenase/reductase y4lA [Novosphingobium arvoryzae]
MTSLQQRVAVITGGARGFGKAFGHALADQGMKVILVDLDLAAARLTAAEIGPNAEAAAGDVSDEQAMHDLMQDIAKRYGGIDILINNAGIHSAEANKPIGELGTARTRRMFEVNIWGVIYCTLAARPFMAGREGAAIVNISSMAAYGSQMAYGVSKLAVRGLTVSFAHELGGDGIRVNALAPGLILTDTIRNELSPDVMAHVKGMQIVKRDGAEQDIVSAMLWLVSPGASFVTGETIRVSGGATLQV